MPISGQQPTYKALKENELKYIVTLGTYVNRNFYRIGIGCMISPINGVTAMEVLSDQ